MKKKKVLKKITFAFLSGMMLSSTVVAESYYSVLGNSMEPILKDRELIKVISKKYKDGDIVVAHTKDGDTIVKRVDGDMLVGESKNSKNYKVSDVNIVGVAQKTKIDNVENENLIKAEAMEFIKLDNSNPIEKAYTTQETALFLHRDTSITGFGRNMHNILGESGGQINNTGKLVKVSGGTGFEKLETGYEHVLGFRPDDENPGMYKLVGFNVDIGTTKEWVSSYLVKDFATVGNDDNNTDAYVDSQGFLRTWGWDYVEALSIGVARPIGNFPGPYGFTYQQNVANWPKVLKPGGQQIIYPTTGTGYFLSNTDTGKNIVKISQPFVAENLISVEFQFRDTAMHPTYDRKMYIHETSARMDIYNGSATDEEILNGAVSPIFTKTDLRSHTHNNIYNWITASNTIVDSGIIGGNTYKIKITSSDTGYDLRIRKREFLQDIVGVINPSGGGYSISRFSAINSQGRIFVGNGTEPKELNLPVDVVMLPKTLIASSSSGQMAGLDTNNNLWLWSNPNDATMVSFPIVDGQPFKELYTIEEIALGRGFQMAKTRHKLSGETNVWVWGSNEFGKIGMGTVSSVSTPTILKRANGIVLSDIQTIAAGSDFSVIVQNTSDGQLIWTAGKNNSGQLGGGLNLVRRTPQIVPGLEGVTDLITESNSEDLNTKNYALKESTKEIFQFGRGVSYLQQATMNSSKIVFPKKYTHDPVTNNFFILDEGNVLRMSDYSYEGPIISDGKIYGPTPGQIIDEGHIVNFNNGLNKITTGKDIFTGHYGGYIVDNNGRLWTRRHPWMGWVGQGQFYSSKGELLGSTENPGPSASYTRPAKLSFTEFAPAIFEKVGGTQRSQSYYVAVDKDGKLWNGGGTYFARLNSALDNYTITNVFSGAYAVFLLDNEGVPWVRGDGGNWRLGINTTSGQSTPVRLNPAYFNNEKVVNIASGTSATLFVVESGDVYFTGTNNYGLIGMEDKPEGYIAKVPEKITTLSNIQKVVIGPRNALALSKDGEVWSWGYAGEGALGDNFTGTRGFLSTAAGNDAPQNDLLTPITTTYLSHSGNKQFQLKGKVLETDKETTRIYSTVLGKEKEFIIQNTEWELDVYDKVKPKNWELNWDINDFATGQNLQTLTRVIIEDARGGLIEQFFAGKIVIDDEMPLIPTWGDTCYLDVNTKAETSCFSEPVFNAGGVNGVNHPIRIYLNVTQKTGDNKAPVRPQISYRKKTTAGFYLNDWSEWTEAKKTADGRYYYDFYEGFLGETQIKVRAIDAAKNITSPNDTSRYVIISNAGGEIKSASGKAFNDTNYGLYNELTFTGSTPSGSAIQSYNVDRRDKLEAQKNPVDAEGNPINHWINLTSTRVLWNGTETKFTDNNLVKELKGNTTYEYRIDAKNNVAIGQPKIVEVTTNPYAPENLSKAPDDTGMALSIAQDKRNQGTILYRLVITDNLTGNVYSKDYTSNNVNEDVLFDLRGSEVYAQSGVKIVNNSIKIQVLLQGANKQWVDIVYEENFINSPAISTDTQKPDVMFMVPEKYKTIVNGDYGTDNRIQLSLFATDNVSPRHKLQVQFSLDGTNWVGLKQTSPTTKEWISNHWSAYQDIYDNFVMGSTSGKKLVYVRVQDEAGNITYANTELTITAPLNRNNDNTGTPTPINDLTNGTIVNDFTDITERHIRKSKVDITVPKDGNLTEVQFSFDGVEWSPWEKIMDNGYKKYINLPHGNGVRTVLVRYRNDSGLITEIEPNKDIITYILDEEQPTGEIKTINGTLVSTNYKLPLKIFTEDNLSSQVKITLLGTNDNGEPFTLHKVFVNAQGQIDVNTNPDGFIGGNKIVYNVGTNNVFGIAGLLPKKFNEVRFKLEDKAGNVSYKTIRIFYKG